MSDSKLVLLITVLYMPLEGCMGTPLALFLVAYVNKGWPASVEQITQVAVIQGQQAELPGEEEATSLPSLPWSKSASFGQTCPDLWANASLSSGESNSMC